MPTCSCGCSVGDCKCPEGCDCGCNHEKGGANWAKKAAESVVFDRAWGVVKGSNCATHNCEDKSAKKDWSYCGKKDCASCGGGCGEDNCRKCNPDEKW